MNEREQFFASLPLKKDKNAIPAYVASAALQAHREQKLQFMTFILYPYKMTLKQRQVAELYAAEMWKEKEQFLIKQLKNSESIAYND